MKVFSKFLFMVSVILLTGAASTVSYQPSRHPIFVIQSVECIRATSGSDSDTVYLSRQPEGKRYPKGTYDMRAGTKKNVGSYYYPTKPGYIALFEEDSFTGDDEIGRFQYTLGEKSGTYVINMTGDGADYKVTIQVRH